jgi:hypothetical protein
MLKNFPGIRIADLITLLSSSLQNSEGGGDSDSDDSCACDREMKDWQNFLCKFPFFRKQFCLYVHSLRTFGDGDGLQNQ